MNAALERIDVAVASSDADRRASALDALDGGVQYAVDRLPLDGQFAVECIGLRASSRKRLAQAAFDARQALGVRRSTGRSTTSTTCSNSARLDYAQRGRRACSSTMRARSQRKATLHWVLVQLVSLVGRLAARPGRWARGRRPSSAAEHYRNHRRRRSSAPGRTPAWPSCGCCASPMRSLTGGRASTSVREARAASRRRARPALSRRRRVPDQVDAAGSSSATSTGGAPRASQRRSTDRGVDAPGRLGRRRWARRDSRSGSSSVLQRRAATAADATRAPDPAPSSPAAGRHEPAPPLERSASGGCTAPDDRRRGAIAAASPKPAARGDAVLHHRGAARRATAIASGSSTATAARRIAC